MKANQNYENVGGIAQKSPFMLIPTTPCTRLPNIFPGLQKTELN